MKTAQGYLLVVTVVVRLHPLFTSVSAKDFLFVCAVTTYRISDGTKTNNKKVYYTETEERDF